MLGGVKLWFFWVVELRIVMLLAMMHSVEYLSRNTKEEMRVQYAKLSCRARTSGLPFTTFWRHHGDDGGQAAREHRLRPAAYHACHSRAR